MDVLRTTFFHDSSDYDLVVKSIILFVVMIVRFIFGFALLMCRFR